MNVRQISISEFKTHCTQEIREVEKGELVLELTRHGKTVAVLQAPSVAPSAPTLEDWVGGGKGTVSFSPGYDPSAPAWGADEWES
jgi:prevent-host-death family protein